MERWCNEADIKWAVERELKKGTQVRNEEMCRERAAGRLRPSCGSGPGPAQGQRGEPAPPSAQTTHSPRPGPARLRASIAPPLPSGRGLPPGRGPAGLLQPPPAPSAPGSPVPRQAGQAEGKLGGAAETCPRPLCRLPGEPPPTPALARHPGSRGGRAGTGRPGLLCVRAPPRPGRAEGLLSAAPAPWCP